MGRACSHVRIRGLDRGLAEASARLTSQLLQDFPRVHATEEFSLFLHQLQQYSFSFRTDRSQAPQIDDQLAPYKTCFGIFVRTRELGGPRCDESALDEQSALAPALDNRDLQHAAAIPRYENATHAPKRFGSNYYIFNVRRT
jgi:hypothetical protein